MLFDGRQCRLKSDAALCSVWSGSTLFARIHFDVIRFLWLKTGIPIIYCGETNEQERKKIIHNAIYIWTAKAQISQHIMQSEHGFECVDIFTGAWSFVFFTNRF